MATRSRERTLNGGGATLDVAERAVSGEREGLRAGGFRARGLPLIERWTRIVPAVGASVPIGIYLWVALHQIGYPYELEWMEGGSVEIVARVVHHQPIYVAPSLHYVPYAYTPLYFWTSALVAHVTGVGFLPLRLVSFGASLGCMAILFFMVRRETRDALAGWLAAGLFAATYQIGGAWFDIGRVDSLYLLLLLATVAVARTATGRRVGVLVGLLAFGAFFTKQSALLALAPVLVVLVAARPRPGTWALGSLATSVVGSTILLDSSTHGWYVYYTLHELVNQGVDRQAGLAFFPTDLWSPTAILLLLGTGGAIVGLTLGAGAGGGWRRRLRNPWLFWLAVAAGFVGSSFVARLHSGGGRDVLIPAYTAIVLVGVLGYHRLRQAIIESPGAPNRVRAAAVALLVALVVTQSVQLWGHPAHLVPDTAGRAAGQRLVARIAATKGDVIVIDHPWYETLAGKPSWAQGEAVHDVLRAGPGRARTDLLRSIKKVLASPSVTTVYLDSPGDNAPFSDFVQHAFVPGPRVFSCFRCFFPVTDVATRPYLEYVRAPAAVSTSTSVRSATRAPSAPLHRASSS